MEPTHKHGHVFQLADLHAKTPKFWRIVVGVNMCPRSFTAFEAILYLNDGSSVPVSMVIVSEDLEADAAMLWPDAPIAHCDLNVHVEK